MNIILKPEYEQFIQSQISSGKYGSVEELIVEAIALLRERERRRDELHHKIAVGTRQIEREELSKTRKEWVLQGKRFRDSIFLTGEPLSGTIIQARVGERY